VLRRLVAGVCSPWIGLVVLAALVLYLSLASTAPRRLAGLLGASPDSLYGHGLVLALWAVLCLNLALVTVRGIRPSFAHAGGWCAHLGVLILTAGAVWYAGWSVHGRCVSQATEQGFSPITSVYLDHGGACYVRTGRDDAEPTETQLPVAPLTGGSEKDLDVPLAGTGERLTARAVRFLPRARLRYDGGGSEVPRLAPPGPPGDPFTGPVLTVELRSGQWRGTRHVAFADVPRPDHWEWVDPPDGGTVGLAFARPSRPLPGTVRIRRAEYRTYPGSVVPMEFRCRVDVETDGEVRQHTLALNRPVRVGRFQLAHAGWRRGRGSGGTVTLLASTRPGLPLVWTGCALIVAGLLYAFYAKPLLLRRRGNSDAR